MASADTVTRSTPVVRVGRLVPVILASVAATASVAAAAGGGTLARVVVTTALPLAVGSWIHAVGRRRPPVPALAVLGALAVAGPVHAAFTSPFAAWAVDSHMVPVALLPSASARLAVAWMVPLLWLVTFVAMAVAAHRWAGTPAGALVLLGTDAAPLGVGNALPRDGYALLWEPTALAHPAYALGACTVLLIAALTHRPRHVAPE